MCFADVLLNFITTYFLASLTPVKVGHICLRRMGLIGFRWFWKGKEIGFEVTGLVIPAPILSISCP